MNQIGDILVVFNSFLYFDFNVQIFICLSDGILSGFNVLESVDLEVDDKVLVVFMDGNDNGFNNFIGNQQMIQVLEFLCYMIGLKGKGLEYNINYLKSLVSNEIFFVEVVDVDELQVCFNDINELIVNIYIVIYNWFIQIFNLDIDELISLRVIFYVMFYWIDQN